MEIKIEEREIPGNLVFPGSVVFTNGICHVIGELKVGKLICNDLKVDDEIVAEAIFSDGKISSGRSIRVKGLLDSKWPIRYLDSLDRRFNWSILVKDGIKANVNIEACGGIKSLGGSIEADDTILAAQGPISSGWNVIGRSIIAKGPIEAKWALEAVRCIEGDGNITAGGPILCGGFIRTTGTVTAGEKYKIFAGLRATKGNLSYAVVEAAKVNSPLGHGIHKFPQIISSVQ